MGMDICQINQKVLNLFRNYEPRQLLGAQTAAGSAQYAREPKQQCTAGETCCKQSCVALRKELEQRTPLDGSQ